LKKSNPLPSQERLRELLFYDQNTGVFTRKVALPGWSAGSVAGHNHHTGYTFIKVDRQSYMAHRLAWMYVYGEDPGALQIDHINGNKSDNRITNLRLATHGQNQVNVKTNKGYYWNKQTKKWKAQIRHKGKVIYLGLYDCPLLARIAYEDKCKELYGEFFPQT